MSDSCKGQAFWVALTSPTLKLHTCLQRGFSGGRTVIGEVRFEGQVHVTDIVLGGANITHIFLNALSLQATSIDSTFIFDGPVKVSLMGDR